MPGITCGKLLENVPCMEGPSSQSFLLCVVARSLRRPWTVFEFAEHCATCNNRSSRCYSPILRRASAGPEGSGNLPGLHNKGQREETGESREQSGLWRRERSRRLRLVHAGPRVPLKAAAERSVVSLSCSRDAFRGARCKPVAINSVEKIPAPGAITGS